MSLDNQDKYRLWATSPHGSRNRYNYYGCRCVECCWANAEYDRTKRRGQQHLGFKVDATGSRRRLQALATLGYSVRELSPKMEAGASHLVQVRSGAIKQTHSGLADRIRTVYDKLRWVESDSKRSGEAKRAAVDNGFLPPSAWDDASIDDPADPIDYSRDAEIVDTLAVELVADGTRPDMAEGLTKLERLAAVRRMVERGIQRKDMVARLGLHDRQVGRLLERIK